MTAFSGTGSKRFACMSSALGGICTQPARSSAANPVFLMRPSILRQSIRSHADRVTRSHRGGPARTKSGLREPKIDQCALHRLVLALDRRVQIRTGLEEV